MTPDPHSEPTTPAWRWVLRGALAVYCLLAGLLILQQPGLQYDEALLVLGSVHMQNSTQELTLPHDPDTWFCAFGRCVPLMTVRYVGALKEYLCLPLFALLGPDAAVLRFVNLLLGLLGIWGLAALLRSRVSPRAAAILAGVLAVHPAYVDLTVFDNGTVAIWMGAFGLLCLALSNYLRDSRILPAFWLGVAAGLGVWARANFLWLLAAIFLAAAIVWRRRLLARPAHYLAAAGGALAGGAPFLAYQFRSNWGTWEANAMFAVRDSLSARLSTRWTQFSEALLSDREHRAMWDGPPLPDWQRWVFPALVLAAAAACLIFTSTRGPRLWARVASLSFLFLAAILLFAPLPVAEHHLVALVPLAAAAVTLAFELLPRRLRWAGAAAALLYLASALHWQIAAVRGLEKTGGVGQWSDAVFPLAEHLLQRYPDREVKILDWGLQNNLYVLTGGKLRSREIYDGASAGPSQQRRWIQTIRLGGVFLLNGPDNRQFPEASRAFLHALDESCVSVRRFSIHQRSGVPYAEIIEIEPSEAGVEKGSPPPCARVTTLSSAPAP